MARLHMQAASHAMPGEQQQVRVRQASPMPTGQASRDAGRSAQAAAREAAAAASRAARDPAMLQQLGSALAALQQQVMELGERRGRDDGSAGGKAQRLDARLGVSR